MDDKEKQELVAAYKALIDRKDEEIKKLKQDNLLLMKSSLKRAEELEQMRDVLETLTKKQDKQNI